MDNEEGEYLDEELEKLRPKDPFDGDEPEDQEEEVQPNRESSEEESMDMPFISPKRFARAREASRKESPTAQKNRFTPLDSKDDRTTIAGRGLRLPSPITPQTDQTQISANSSTGSFVEDIKKQHDEFRMMMDRLMAAAKPPASDHNCCDFGIQNHQDCHRGSRPYRRALRWSMSRMKRKDAR